MFGRRYSNDYKGINFKVRTGPHNLIAGRDLCYFFVIAKPKQHDKKLVVWVKLI